MIRHTSRPLLASQERRGRYPGESVSDSGNTANRSGSSVNNSQGQVASANMSDNGPHMFQPHGLRWSPVYNLTPDNYRNWKTRVEPLMRTLGFMGILSKTELPPDTRWGDPPSMVENFWRCEAHCKSLLISTLSGPVVLQVMHLQYAFEVWNKIKMTFESKSFGAVAHLRRQFIETKYDDKCDMRDHINKLNLIREQLGNANITVTDKEMMVQLLLSLPEATWSSLMEIYFLKTQDVELSTLESALIQEADRRTAVNRRMRVEQANTAVERAQEERNRESLERLRE